MNEKNYFWFIIFVYLLLLVAALVAEYFGDLFVVRIGRTEPLGSHFVEKVPEDASRNAMSYLIDMEAVDRLQ